MRLWHGVVAVAVLAVVFSLARDPTSRIFLIIFSTGLGEVVIGLASVLALFEAVGAIGEAQGLPAHAQAVAATTAVLAAATAAMSAWIFVGFWLVWATT